MGGIHPEVVFGAYLVLFWHRPGCAAAALTLSVWCSKTYEVLLVCYLCWIAVLLMQPLACCFRPGCRAAGSCTPILTFFVLALQDPGSVQILTSPGLCGLRRAVALLVVIAIFGLRAVVLRSGSVAPTKNLPRARKWTVRIPGLLRPSLDGNPVLLARMASAQAFPLGARRVVVVRAGALGFSIYAFLLCVGSTVRGWEERFGILIQRLSSGHRTSGWSASPA